MTLGAWIFRRLAPVWRVNPGDSTITEALADSLAAPLEDVYSVVEGDETYGPWATALDPHLTPARFLAWLAQFPGVQLPQAAGEAEQRDRIEQAAGFYRGTRRSIRVDVQRTLTGNKFVRVFARADGQRWKQVILTRTSETPDPTATAAAALAQKPAGVYPQELVVSDAPLIDEGTLSIDSVGVDIDDATLGDVT